MLSQLMIVIGALAFVVSVITEVIKGVRVLQAVPTDIVVVTLSIVLTVVAAVAYAQHTQLVLTWYIILGAIIAGFFVAFVAMFGWTKLIELSERFQYKK